MPMRENVSNVSNLAAYQTQQGYRAFLREDDLFDIYNAEGIMISERLPDYY